MENCLKLFLTYLMKLLSLFTLCSLNGSESFTVIMNGQKKVQIMFHFTKSYNLNEIIRITFLVWWTWF